MLRLIAFLIALTALLGCAEAVTSKPDARILLLGDSMMASNAALGATVADALEDALEQPVIDRSVIGARYFYALPVSGSLGLRLDAQYRPGPWGHIVLNGGGNDLLFGCGCGTCDRMLDRLASRDGRSGAIPDYVARLRKTGARVIYVGYLRNPGTATPIRACGPAGNELDRRLATMARLDPGVTFVSIADLVPAGDASFHQLDRIHPSPKGSRAIAARIAPLIRKDQTRFAREETVKPRRPAVAHSAAPRPDRRAATAGGYSTIPKAALGVSCY